MGTCSMGLPRLSRHVLLILMIFGGREKTIFRTFGGKACKMRTKLIKLSVKVMNYHRICREAYGLENRG
jgi:hypothetical protein